MFCLLVTGSHVALVGLELTKYPRMYAPLPASLIYKLRMRLAHKVQVLLNTNPDTSQHKMLVFEENGVNTQ